MFKMLKPCLTLLLGFYAGIILYVFFAIMHIDTLANFETAVAFESIGFVLLGYFVMQGVGLRHIKTGYFVPLMVVTILYTCILDAINLLCIAEMKMVWFTLIHFVLLFAYCIVSIPMYIMGRNK